MNRSIRALAVALLVSVLCVFAFAACNIKLEDMDGSEYYDSPEKEHSLEMIDDFFFESLKNPDFVVTCKDKEGATVHTETVKGTTSCTVYKDGAKTYAYKKGEHLYVAYVSSEAGQGGEETHRYYCSDSSKSGYWAGAQGETMADKYNDNFCRFMSKSTGIGLVRDYSEGSGEFHCVTHIERVSGFATATLTFTYTAADRTITFTASSEGDKVQSARLVIDETIDLTWTFVYGGASVTLPDTDAWDGQEG